MVPVAQRARRPQGGSVEHVRRSARRRTAGGCGPCQPSRTTRAVTVGPAVPCGPSLRGEGAVLVNASTVRRLAGNFSVSVWRQSEYSHWFSPFCLSYAYAALANRTISMPLGRAMQASGFRACMSRPGSRPIVRLLAKGDSTRPRTATPYLREASGIALYIRRRGRVFWAIEGCWRGGGRRPSARPNRWTAAWRHEQTEFSCP